MAMAPLQQNYHVIRNRQTGEQMMYWNRLNKENSNLVALFNLSQCVICSPLWRLCTMRSFNCIRPIILFDCKIFVTCTSLVMQYHAAKWLVVNIIILSFFIRIKLCLQIQLPLLKRLKLYGDWIRSYNIDWWLLSYLQRWEVWLLVSASKFY